MDGDQVTDDAGAPRGADPSGSGEPKAADIMERNVVTIAPDATVHELVQLLREKDLGGVPVVDGAGRLVGMVTEGDLVVEDADVRAPHFVEVLGSLVFLGGQKKFEKRLRKMVGSTVGDIMTTRVLAVAPGDPVGRAATIMADERIDRVPVVDDGRVVGIIARHDIVRMLGI